MVEIALVVPLLILLLVITIDFGRVFFGWVGLQNAARIGANYAGAHPTAWTAPSTPIKAGQRQELIDQIQFDARSINCDLQAIPTPVFSAVGGAAATEIGSHATVALECDFDLITGAFVGAIVGNPVRIGATAAFPVRNGAVANFPTPTPTGTPGPTPTPTGTPGPTPTPTPTPVCVAVPIVNGLGAPAAANAAIVGAGLTPNGIPDIPNGQKGVASAQSPGAGICVALGSTVTYHYRPN